MVQMKIRIAEKNESLYVKVTRIADDGAKETKYIDSGMEWGEPEFDESDVVDAINEAFPNDIAYRIVY